MLHKYNKISNKDDKILIRGTIVNNLWTMLKYMMFKSHYNKYMLLSLGQIVMASRDVHMV